VRDPELFGEGLKALLGDAGVVIEVAKFGALYRNDGSGRQWLLSCCR
jgi:hypothetical protein